MKFAFQNPELRKISKYQTQMRNSVKLASDLTRCENYKKSASELPTLRNILSIQSKKQGSTRSAFNKQIWTQADEAKTQRLSTRVFPTNSRVASEDQARA